MPVVATRDLGVVLGRLPVLRSISLSVEAGQAVALLGANGSGKTTLVRAILGLVPHQHGDVELFGTPLAQFRDWTRVGYVPQRASIQYPQATVREVVAMGRLARRKPFRRQSDADRQLVAEAIAAVELAGKENTPFAWLSGGQQQRALIARALCGQAELLVLDEPLAGMDVRSQERLAETLARLKADGLTQLVVLHETDALEAVLDREIVLRDGRVMPPGTLHLDRHHHETEHHSHPPLLAGTLDGR
ncbi:MAG: metal ABC transporter ATP-binding protein [Propionibacteriaceae bacterium]|jgi:zinc transport system ATP-binding protein|nr:metal ABC transporter ATP-binding protein [Propionibacteriaceae bacterium]